MVGDISLFVGNLCPAIQGGGREGGNLMFSGSSLGVSYSHINTPIKRN